MGIESRLLVIYRYEIRRITHFARMNEFGFLDCVMSQGFEDYPSNPFKTGSIHDPKIKDFYIMCAQQLQKYDLGNCVSITMQHLIQGGIRIKDFMVSGKVKCRGKRISFDEISGVVVKVHNKSFEELESKLSGSFSQYEQLQVIRRVGPVEDNANVTNRIFHSLSAREQKSKIRLISDLFYVNAFAKPFMSSQDTVILDNLLAFSLKFKFVKMASSVDLEKFFWQFNVIDRHLLSFVLDSQVWEFCCMPFGWSPAVYVAQALSRFAGFCVRYVDMSLLNDIPSHISTGIYPRGRVNVYML